jgi:anionic cell wall polymer biosynthesis LytR-Cps2A-Psr (LCP) family protein
MLKAKTDSGLLFLVAILVLLVGGGTVAALLARSNPAEEAFAADRVINTLLIVEKDGKPLFTHLLMYYPATKRAALFDVPGETGLIIASLGKVDRIDALYSPRDPEPYRAEIAKLLDVEIPFQLVFDLENLAKTIDLLEGIDLFIADPVEAYGLTPPVLLPSGAVRLDGAKAITFATYSLPDEDAQEGPLRRHRLTLALLKRLGERNAALERPELGRLLNSLVRHNMDLRVLNRLWDEYARIDVERMVVQRVAGNLKQVSGQELLFPYYDGDLIKDMVKQALASLVRVTDQGLSDRVYTVEVLNGTANIGLAKRTADLMQGFGYEAVSVGNADANDYAETVIINRSGSDQAARVFADIIRCPTIRDEPRAADGSLLVGGADFTILIGKDFDGRYVVR